MPARPVIDYYFAPMSGYAYLGHGRFVALAKTVEAKINYHALDMARVFSSAGSFPPAKYPEIRQTHRKADMGRWAAHLGIPINTTPAFWPVPMDLACRVIAGAGDAQADVTASILAAVWMHDLDISKPEDMERALKHYDLDSVGLLTQASLPEVKSLSANETDKAIEIGIFGSPTYVFSGEWFFGQDRLEFLQSALLSSAE